MSHSFFSTNNMNVKCFKNFDDAREIFGHYASFYDASEMENHPEVDEYILVNGVEIWVNAEEWAA